MTRIAICAFHGWSDAEQSATGAVDHLLQVWPSRTLARISAENYIDFQVNRPQVRLDEARRKVIDWPDTRIDHVQPPRGLDIVLVHGPEPSLRWGGFCTELVERLLQFEVSHVILLGAVLSDAPHTRPLPVAERTEPGLSEPVAGEIYEGPVGISAIIARTAVSQGLRTSSMWVEVPHYVSHSGCPKAVLALVRALQEHISAPIPLGDLEEEAAAWQRGADELAREDAEIGSYVAELESSQDASDMAEASGDAIAREFEQFLRRREDED